MLYLALVPALALLLLARWAAGPSPPPPSPAARWVLFLGAGAGLVMMPLAAVMFFPVNVGLFLLLAVALAARTLVRRRVRSFVPLAAIAFVAAYGTAGWFALAEQAAADRLRKQYPFESMADRVPEPRDDQRGTLPAAARPEREVVDDGDFMSAVRARHLRRLHERTVDAFVNSPGFGVARVTPLPTEESLRDRSERGPVPDQPGSPSAWPPAVTFETLPDAARESHRRMHADAVLDFVNPRGWGYVAEGRRAAGFLRHAFSRVPEPAAGWRVEAVELVGLLRHPGPVVYRSDRLPAMADLGDAPTRPLDRFEAAALDAVRNGEDGFAARRGDELKFVGAIRSANPCVACHGGRRGDLLGAFSYSLRLVSR